MSGEEHVLTVDVYAQDVGGTTAAVRYEARHPSGRALAEGEAAALLAPMGAAARDDLADGEVARLTVRRDSAADSTSALATSLVADNVALGDLAGVLVQVAQDLRERAAGQR